jgi:hypothetical protein
VVFEEFDAALDALTDQSAAARLDEGLLSFCLPVLILYGDSLLEEQILVTNDSALSYASG